MACTRSFTENSRIKDPSSSYALWTDGTNTYIDENFLIYKNYIKKLIIINKYKRLSGSWNEADTGGTCTMHMRDEKYIQKFIQKTWMEEVTLADVNRDYMIIWNEILMEEVVDRIKVAHISVHWNPLMYLSFI